MCLVGGTPFYVFKYLPPNLPTLYVLGGCFRGFEQIPLQMRLKIRDIAPSQITKDRQIERPLVQRQIAEFLTGPPLALEILSLDKLECGISPEYSKAQKDRRDIRCRLDQLPAAWWGFLKSFIQIVTEFVRKGCDQLYRCMNMARIIRNLTRISGVGEGSCRCPRMLNSAQCGYPSGKLGLRHQLDWPF